MLLARLLEGDTPGGILPGKLLFKSPFSKNQSLMLPSGSLPPFFTMMNGARNWSQKHEQCLRQSIVWCLGVWQAAVEVGPCLKLSLQPRYMRHNGPHWA